MVDKCIHTSGILWSVPFKDYPQSPWSAHYFARPLSSAIWILYVLDLLLVTYEVYKVHVHDHIDPW